MPIAPNVIQPHRGAGVSATPEADSPGPTATPLPKWAAPAAIGAIALLLATFALLATSAAATKSPTFDEPLHLIGSYVHRYEHDYRVNPEDPALFGVIASLPFAPGAITLHTDVTQYQQMPFKVLLEWEFALRTLYANDAQHLTIQSRLMFVAVGVLLGALIAVWAWSIRGPTAALVAVGLFALDPNFLAHTALIKNDVSLSLVMLLAAFSTWRLGVNGRWYWIIALLVSCGAAVNVKFSGLLAGPVIATLLLIRALIDRPWTLANIPLRTRLARLAASATLALACLLSTCLITWTVYGFRYAATSDGQVLDTRLMVLQTLTDNARTVANNRNLVVTNEDLNASSADPSTWPEEFPEPAEASAAIWLMRHHLLPQAWCFGFIFTYLSTLIRPAYLNGQVSVVGFPWYFPLAMLYKTPTATLVAAAATIALAALYLTRSGFILAPRPQSRDQNQLCRWALIAWGTLPAVYLASAISSNLNLGLRHILPVYPFIFIAIGVAATASITRWGRWAVLAVALVAAGLATESLAAWPDYIAFFNAPTGGSRGGFNRLSDSNLDWGQDQIALAQWQKIHPEIQIYYYVFGTGDPGFFGLQYIPIPSYKPAHIQYPRHGVLAIGATALQGEYEQAAAINSISLRDYLAIHDPPRQVLHGTIYLFDVK